MVNRLAGESVLKGADIFAPGVLGCSKGGPRRGCAWRLGACAGPHTGSS